jgi:divalent metal cation (Fe/Co/Zn/Cd) transporter
MSELVVVPSGGSVTAPAASQEWLSAVRRAKALSWISLVWMSLEGGIAIATGILAGSVALIGFGIDSAIEGVASVVIIWRFTGARVLSHAAEERAQKLVAIQFFVLAPYVTFEALQALINSEHPEVSGLGMALTASSVIGMPLLGVAKQRVAKTLGSQATHGEGTQNLLCAYLAAAVFLGLAGNALFGAWWLDPIAAFFIAGIALREGIETWRGEGCCAAPALTPNANADCDDDCCD